MLPWYDVILADREALPQLVVAEIRFTGTIFSMLTYAFHHQMKLVSDFQSWDSTTVQLTRRKTSRYREIKPRNKYFKLVDKTENIIRWIKYQLKWHDLFEVLITVWIAKFIVPGSNRFSSISKKVPTIIIASKWICSTENTPGIEMTDISLKCKIYILGLLSL